NPPHVQTPASVMSEEAVLLVIRYAYFPASGHVGTLSGSRGDSRGPRSKAACSAPAVSAQHAFAGRGDAVEAARNDSMRDVAEASRRRGDAAGWSTARALVRSCRARPCLRGLQ